MSLHPTLWRTCRALANKRRLACLRSVLLRPGDSVGEIAAGVKLPPDQASLCLRALQARGVLHASRDGRWVRYFPWPDPLVPVAAPLLVVMTRALVDDACSEKELLRTLTAFTHPRRLAILGCLQRAAPLSFSLLMRKSHVSSPALVRHLRKLSDRGLVREERGGWSLAPALKPLAAGLLHLSARAGEPQSS